MIQISRGARGAMNATQLYRYVNATARPGGSVGGIAGAGEAGSGEERVAYFSLGAAYFLAWLRGPTLPVYAPCAMRAWRVLAGFKRLRHSPVSRIERIQASTAVSG